MRNGKVNKFHKVEYMGALRNRDPLLCLLSALAFYFFWRWGYVVTDPTAKKPADPIPPHRRLPSFFGPNDYYHLHALPGEIKYPERQWAYEGQRDWTEKLFTGAGIQSTKKTHGGGRDTGIPDPAGLSPLQRGGKLPDFLYNFCNTEEGCLRLRYHLPKDGRLPRRSRKLLPPPGPRWNRPQR
jgi:hypothetical protein